MSSHAGPSAAKSGIALSPLARHPVEALEASTTSYNISSEPVVTPPPRAVTSDSGSRNGPVPSTPRGSRMRPRSASTRFPVAVSSGSHSRMTSIPLDSTIDSHQRFADELPPLYEQRKYTADNNQGTMSMGLKNFVVGEVSDEDEETVTHAELRDKTAEKGKGKEKVSEQKTDPESDKIRTRSKVKDKGKEVVRELFSPIRSRLAPVLHPSHASAEAGPSKRSPGEQRDPGHRSFKLGKPSQQLDLEAQTERKPRELWSLWQIATAITMILNVITFILAVATFLSVSHDP